MHINPKVSIVIPTYNRASTLPRCLESVLNQSYKNIEIIIVNDGSTDNTTIVLQDYQKDARVKTIRHQCNKGVCAALNTGLDSIEGEWFTRFDSDDEMVPDAIEKMIEVLNTVDSTITAITCNCIDTTTGKYSGKGLSSTGYISAIDILQKCSGEHWGMTKTEILGTDRLNERISGGEGVLWHKLSKRAKRYYLHEALRIYHTEGNDRLCTKRPIDLKKEIEKHSIWSNEEPEYIEDLRKYSLKRYLRHRMYYGMHCSITDKKKQGRIVLMELVKKGCIKQSIALLYLMIYGVKNTEKMLHKVL